jgi:hypothetical protein
MVSRLASTAFVVARIMSVRREEVPLGIFVLDLDISADP